jgi:hypothetical protein
MLLAAAGTTACRSPEQRVQESVESAASWTATAEMSAAAYAGNSAPRPFTRTLIATIRDALRREAARADEERTGPAAARAAAAAQAMRMAASEVDELMAVVERRDRGQASALAGRLHGRAAALRALAEAGP